MSDLFAPSGRCGRNRLCSIDIPGVIAVISIHFWSRWTGPKAFPNAVATLLDDRSRRRSTRALHLANSYNHNEKKLTSSRSFGENQPRWMCRSVRQSAKWDI